MTALVLLVVMVLSLLVAPCTSTAQPSTHVHRIGRLTGGSRNLDPNLEVFRQELRALGYVVSGCVKTEDKRLGEKAQCTRGSRLGENTAGTGVGKSSLALNHLRPASSEPARVNSRVGLSFESSCLQ